MRYLKVLLLAVFVFLCMVFFFQNQAPLSQQIALNLNLYFIPPMQSIPLPFYFIVIGGFLVGCLFAVVMLFWDRCTISARAMKRQWKINSLQKQVGSLQNELDKNASALAKAEEANIALKKEPAAAPAPEAKKPA